jgi:multidrug efflux pump subunit AcrA (membrane-fusion protein)
MVAIVAAFLVVGPSSQSATTGSRTVTVAEGVVQSTVSGSGNLQAASQLNLGFKTSGVVTHIYVKQGQHVGSGQLLATLDPQSAEVTLEQAKATLQAAEATLAQEEESGGETTGAGNASKATAAAFGPSGPTGEYNGPTGATGATGTTSTAAGGATGSQGSSGSPAAAGGQTGATQTTSTSTTGTATTSAARSAPATTTTSRTTTTMHTSSSEPKQSAATRDANLASARAAVKSDKLAVQSAEETVSDTKLYAPAAGTIVSLTGEVGETVSGSGTSKDSSASSSSGTSSSAAGTGAGTGATTRGAGTSSSSSSTGSTSSSSSSAFAVLSDLSSIQLVVPLSESEIGSVSVGQPATVTIEALEGRKVAAEVVNVATLSTTNSGVVSYDVTFQLKQLTGGLKPGMSASAEVVVRQAEGVNVPTTAISGGSVTVIEGEKRVRRTVVTGLAGNSSTIILSGLKAGEKIALPIASTSSSGSSLTSKLAGRTGGLGGGLGGGFTGGFGGGGGFRGGGG